MPPWLIAVLVTATLAVLGGVFNVALEVGQINDKLDRNCRILVQLDQDIRFQAAVTRRQVRRLHSPFPDVSC